MSKKFSIKLIAILSCFLIAITSFYFATLTRTVKADFVVGDFEDAYFVGDTLNVPNATVILNGEQTNAKFEIVCPDGDVFTNKSLFLNQYGNYEIKYYLEGTSFSHSVYVRVDKPLYEVVGKGSVTYGYHEYLDEVINGETKQYGGAITSIASGSKLVINKVINLSEFSFFSHCCTCHTRKLRI